MYSPKVAVVDSGVDTQNQEIMQHVIQGFSFQKSAGNYRWISSV